MRTLGECLPAAAVVVVHRCRSLPAAPAIMAQPQHATAPSTERVSKDAHAPSHIKRRWECQGELRRESGIITGFKQHRRSRFLEMLCCVCVLSMMTYPARATLVASSSITHCSTTDNETLACAKKMVVSLTVEAGQLAGEESLVLINSAADETTSNGAAGAPTVVFSPLRVTVSRSAVRYRYPLFYVQNYNAKPFEATVKGKLLNQCNADLNPSTATCGVAYDSNANMIPYSQGFCCDCSMCQTLGFCDADARANKACNVFDAFTTASCLRFGQRWYSGYDIGSYITWFTLNVTVSRNTSVGTAGDAAELVPQTLTMRLSPSNTGDTAGDGWGAVARIIGSFAPNDQPLDLASHMLFAPVLPANDERVRAGAAEWMLLPTNLVTLDGRECNKVGVSYEAFVSQGNKCNLNPGSCLSSQLEDYRTSDLTRIASGKTARYMAAGYRQFDLERVTNVTSTSAFSEKTSPYISYVATSPAATMVTLTVSADDLQYVVAVAKGVILSAEMNKGTLEAGTAEGVLRVVVQNTASVTGRLVIEVHQCTDGVFPISAQTASLAPHQQYSLQYSVYMQGSRESGTAQCTVVVRNAEEAVTDSRVVSWRVSATGFTNGTQGGTANSGVGGSTEESSSATTCDKCGALDIVCAVKHVCWALAFLDVVVFGAIAGGAFGLFWFRRVFCCCFYQHPRKPPLCDHRSHDGPTRLSGVSNTHRRSCSALQPDCPRTSTFEEAVRLHQHQGGSCDAFIAVTAQAPSPMQVSPVAAHTGSSRVSLGAGETYAQTASSHSQPLGLQRPPSPQPLLVHTPTSR